MRRRSLACLCSTFAGLILLLLLMLLLCHGDCAKRKVLTATPQNSSNSSLSPIATNNEEDAESMNSANFHFPLGANSEEEDDDEDSEEEDLESESHSQLDLDRSQQYSVRSDLQVSQEKSTTPKNNSQIPRPPNKRRRRRKLRRSLDAKSDYLLPQNFVSPRRRDIPVTYRLHDDLLRIIRDNFLQLNISLKRYNVQVTHPNKIISVSMSVFLYQIIKLIPEFSLYYSLNYNEAVKLISNNDVRVNYTGHIRYYLPFSTESLCNSVDVKFFPFDIQQCTLLFGSWAHSNDSLKYSLYSKNLSLIDFYDNQEWQLDLSRSHIMSDGFLYDYLDPPLFWEMIVIDLVVARQSFYYVFNLVIPSAIITFVAVIGFHTPSTSGRMRDAKFRLGIMTLMSMSMILLAIVEDMPKFSISSSRKGRGSFSGVPLIGLYYFMLLAIVGLSTVTSSMFVFVERDVRLKRGIPWYLRLMLAFDGWFKADEEKLGNGLSVNGLKRGGYSYSTNAAFNPFCRSSTDDLAASESLLSTSGAVAAGGGRLNGFVGGAGAAAQRQQHRRSQPNDVTQDPSSSPTTTRHLAAKNYAQSIALSLLRLIPQSQNHEQRQSVGGGDRNALNHHQHVHRRGSPFSMLIEQQQQQLPAVGNVAGSSSLELGAALGAGAYHQEVFCNPVAGAMVCLRTLKLKLMQ